MVSRKFNKDTLTAHNQLRKLHGCPKLVYDSKLARDAQKWAEHLASISSVQHSSAKGYGENLAYHMSTAGSNFTGREATRMWYDEIDYYDFKGSFRSNTGHFTQLIWKSSKKAGFGVAKSSDGRKTYVVGRYTPAGNVIGRFMENVPKPVKKAPPTQEFINQTKDNKSCTIL